MVEGKFRARIIAWARDEVERAVGLALSAVGE